MGIPQPTQTPANAARIVREGDLGHDMMGAYRDSGSRVRLSARAVQRLLAGEIAYEQFAAAHGWDGEHRGRNPFLRALIRGEMIDASRVESAGDKDDDWLEFQFANDPAVAAFRIVSDG